jgi:hypothetical protein
MPVQERPLPGEPSAISPEPGIQALTRQLPVFVYRGPAMTKYKVVFEKVGGWCVIVTGKAGEDKFWGFRDEAHAREWVTKVLEERQLAAAY